MKIFVSIAAYRDPELPPTLRDLFLRAAHPSRLRVVVCDQYGPEAPEFPADLASNPQIERLAVPWQESRGACWARAKIQEAYAGEAFYLQLDSHHRFAEGWDEILLEELAKTGREKAILSAYVPAYRPAIPSEGRPEERDAGPLALQFDAFHTNGIVVFRPSQFLSDYEGKGPIAARFLSGHFLFAPGAFVKEVPYDGELYFIGEEISLSVRAFLTGWYLFHPSRDVVWHEYTRKYRPNKHWSDHEETAVATPWWQRDRVSKEKVLALLHGVVEVGSPSPATPLPANSQAAANVRAAGVRTLADYEAYAGLSFRRHRVHPATLAGLPPPTVACAGWEATGSRYVFTIPIPALLRETVAMTEAWILTVLDDAGVAIYRSEVFPEALAYPREHAAQIPVAFDSASAPARWTLRTLLAEAPNEHGHVAEGAISVLPEPPEVILVTALVDLGRGALSNGFARPYEDYLAQFEALLASLRGGTKLVVYLAPDDVAAAARVAAAQAAGVTVTVRPWAVRRTAPLVPRIEALRTDRRWAGEGWLAQSPQATLSGYLPLVFEKFALLEEVAKEYAGKGPAEAMKATFFWVDAALPRTVAAAGLAALGRAVPEGQLRLFAFPYPKDTSEIHGFIRDGLTRFAGDSVTHVLRGGFFGGAPSAITAGASAFYTLLEETLDAGYLGTEESLFAILHARKQSPFHAVTAIGPDGLIPAAPGGRIPFESALPSMPDRVALLAEARAIVALPRRNGPANVVVPDGAAAALLARFTEPGDLLLLAQLSDREPTSAFVTAADRERAFATLLPTAVAAPANVAAYVQTARSPSHLFVRPPTVDEPSKATSALYVLTFNAPDQFRRWAERAAAVQPELLAPMVVRVLVNNSTDRRTDDAYDELCATYQFRQVRHKNLGITGGRMAATRHFLEESEADQFWYFEDDMLVAAPSGDPLCRNGFRRFVPELPSLVTEILANEPGLDGLKLSYTEHFGCHQLDWSFVNATPEVRRDEYPMGSATVVRTIRTHRGLPYALGDIYYSHWPLVLTRSGAKLLLEGADAVATEADVMDYVHQCQRTGKFALGVLLASPIEHSRSSDYDAKLRRES